MTGSWQPQPASDQRLEDVTLEEWVGQALGAASMCWRPTPTGEFDSVRAGQIHEALHTHVQSVIQGVIEGEAKHSVQRATVRQLLNELRTRAENYAQVRKSGSGWLADRVDDAYVSLEGSPMMDGGREP